MSPAVFATLTLAIAFVHVMAVLIWLAACVGAEQWFRLRPAASWTLAVVPPAVVVWVAAYGLAAHQDVQRAFGL